jgi:replication-associated recombination protein RarA
METLGFVVEVSQRKQQDLLLLAETFKQEATFIGHTTSSPVLRFTQGPTLSTLLKDIA